MRLIKSLCLILILAACAAPLQPVAPEVNVTSSAANPVSQEKEDTLPGTAALLAVWKGEQPEIRLVDLAAAQDVPGFKPVAAYPEALSRDGSMAAAIESKGQSCEPFAGGSSCRGNAAVLHLIDLQSGGEVTAPVSTDGWAWPLAFSPDASQLALALHENGLDELRLYETATGEAIARQQLSLRPSHLSFTMDGRFVIVYGQALGKEPGISIPEPPRVLLVEAAGLKVAWDQALSWVQSGSWCELNCEASHERRGMVMLQPGLAFSQDGGLLYIVHAGEDMLTTVDFAARSVSSMNLHEQQSWIERFLSLFAGTALAKGEMNGTVKSAVLSPDGERLYVVEQLMSGSTGGEPDAHPSKDATGLQVIDVGTGTILASRDIQGSRILASPDGAFLVVEDGTQGRLQTYIVDAASLETAAQLEGWEVRLIKQLDGQPVLVASRSGEKSTELAVLESGSFELTPTWTVDHYAFWQEAQ